MKQTLEEAIKESIHKHYNCNGTYPCSEREYCEHCNGCNTAFDCNECGADEYKEGFIQGAKWQAEQSPWISVKERLPEENEKVFFVLVFRGIHKDYLTGLYKRGKWVTEQSTYAPNSFWGIVTHWMPIPEFNK